MKTILTVVLFLTAVSAVFGQVLSDKNAQRLDADRVASEWSRVQVSHNLSAAKMAPHASVNVAQARATIEVTGSGQGITAVFSSLVPLPGGTIAFRMTLPNGTVVPMEGYTISSEGGLVGAMLWNGWFPSVWPSGQTLLEAVIVSHGDVSYVSAYVSVNGCCELTGPLERVDVSADGNEITITGSFQAGTLATVNGQQLPVAMSFSPTTGAYVGKINIHDIYEGQKTLTVCSGGSCSSRTFYVVRRGNTITPTPSVPSN